MHFAVPGPRRGRCVTAWLAASRPSTAATARLRCSGFHPLPPPPPPHPRAHAQAGGASLAPDQAKLEAAYKSELSGAYGVAFSRLLALNNMPIKRFADFLVRRGQMDAYMKLLVDSFNPGAGAGLMCRCGVHACLSGVWVCGWGRGGGRGAGAGMEGRQVANARQQQGAPAWRGLAGACCAAHVQLCRLCSSPTGPGSSQVPAAGKTNGRQVCKHAR